MRIISGTFGSRQLKGTPPPGIRPTSDKLRETLFNVLGDRVNGSRFLDAFAGTGAVGIEAISRGAHEVTFVDSSRKATAIIRKYLATLEIRAGFRLLELEFSKACRTLEREGATFDIMFLDPPYDREDLYTSALEMFGSLPLLNEDAILVVEHSKRDEFAGASGILEKYRTLTQGDSSLSFYRKRP